MNCTLLSIAGTGSTFLWKNYESFSHQKLQHNHMKTNVDLDCGLVTIRDPAERLQSGFLYEFMYPKHGRARLTRFHNASFFMDALTDKSNPNHQKVSRLVHLSKHKRSPGDDGSFFLFPQSRYFVNNLNKTMHVFCTKCLSKQWSIFSNNLSASMHMERSKNAKSTYLRKSILNDAQKHVIRTLFPQDMQLINTHCHDCW